MAELRVQNRKLFVDISDNEGIKHEYLCWMIRSNPDIVIGMQRQGAKKFDSYTVMKENGIWKCTCSSARYRKDMCKHIKKAIEVSAIWEYTLQENTKVIMLNLSRPFEPDQVKWKPQVTKGDSAMVVAYMDARLVMDRLDTVVGSENWKDSYSSGLNGSVVCRLEIKFGNEWVAREDVGSPSKQPNEHDRVKAAYSDALKRAAVKFGIGRYLYRLPMQWVKYDQQRKRLLETPRMPEWALPDYSDKQPVAQYIDDEEIDEQDRPHTEEAPKGQMPNTRLNHTQVSTVDSKPTPMPPDNASRMYNRISEYEERLVREGKCKPFDLIEHTKAHAGPPQLWDDIDSKHNDYFAKVVEHFLASRGLPVPKRVTK